MTKGKGGRLVSIRRVNKETGKVETKPYWVDGDEVYEIEKQDPETGEWKQPSIVEDKETK